MSSLLQDLQSMLAGGVKPSGSSSSNVSGQMSSGIGGMLQGMLGQGDMGKLLGPAMLGGLMGALMSNKTGRQLGGAALVLGGGAMLWSKYKDRIREAYTNATGSQGMTPSSSSSGNNLSPASATTSPATAFAETAVSDRAVRLIRALIFAAKSDGHIDEKEQQTIQQSIKDLQLGADTERLVQEALAQPLDPALIAEGVTNEEEAFEVYIVSCAAIDVDHFMERSYLDALAQALKIPKEMALEIEKNMRENGK